MNAGAYPAVSANTIVLWGRWFAHRSRQGRQSTIQAIPLLAAGQVGSGYPNLVDDVDEAEIKTEPWETTPLIDGALWALPLLPTADQQLGAFGGYELRRGDEPPLIVELLESTGTIPATQEMLDALAQACIQSEATYLDIELGDPIQAVWIGHVANLSTPAPQPPDGFLTTAQTTSLIARYTWRPRGTWSSTTAYEQRDVVKYLGAMWVADAPSTGVTPATGSTWRSVVDKGDPGATGTPGSPGAPGNPGPANSLAIGTVTTGAAGSSAAAQSTGTAPSQTLNLTVPRGDKGDGSVSSVDGNPGPNVTLASDGAAGTATKRSLGTGATQAAAGNDSRITGAAQKAQNLADLPDKAASRTNLGLGSAATSAAADLRDAATHTGQRTSASISDFAEAVQDAVAALLGAGSNITLNYNDAANTLTVSATGGGGGGLDAEAVRDAIGVALVGVAPVSVVVNDAADTITISSTATQNSTDAQLRDRSTHTGLDPISAVNGLQAALDAKQAADTDLTTIAALDATTAGALATDGAGWIRKTYAQLKTSLGLVKSDVGLGNVDNTADTAKPVSAAQQTALNGKAPLRETREYVQSAAGIATPVNIVGAYVTCYRGGAGGGSGRRGAAGSVRCGGGGGGAGGMNEVWVPATAWGATYDVVVGSGGAGGTAVTTDDTNGSAGGDGGASTVTTNGIPIRPTTPTGGGGGTSATGSAGAGAGPQGSAGGAASTSGGAGAGGNRPSNSCPAGGGAGGGVSSGNAAGAGGAGGDLQAPFPVSSTAGSGGVVGGALPTAGTSPALPLPGGGGGGGAGNASGAGQDGAPGGPYGGGGGGGGASVNGFPSGAGGKGGDGYVRIAFLFG